MRHCISPVQLITRILPTERWERNAWIPDRILQARLQTTSIAILFERGVVINIPTTINKQRLLSQLFSSLKKSAPPADSQQRPVLDQFIYGLCREWVSREQADQAFRNLKECFFDWNEVRVSSVRELEEALADLPNASERAQRVISFLQEVFETTFSFDLEGL